MPRPKTADRSTVAEKNITFRASERTRSLLDALVAAAQEEAEAIGANVSMGSYLKGLIEREARAKGIEPKTTVVTITSKKKKEKASPRLA